MRRTLVTAVASLGLLALVGLAIAAPGESHVDESMRWIGSITNHAVTWNATTNEWRFNGACRPTGLSSLSNRYELKWVAGQRGLVTVTGSVLFTTDHDFELLGLNAVAADCTYYADGGLLLGSHGADGDATLIAPWLSAGNKTPWTGITWGTGQQVEWECDVQTTAGIASEIIWAGLKLTNTDVITTDNDSVFFRYQDTSNSGKWVANDSTNNVDTSTDSGVTVAVNTRYHLKIAIDSSRVARFFINGVLVKTSGALTASTNFIPYIGVKASGQAAVKTLRVHGQSISRVVA